MLVVEGGWGAEEDELGALGFQHGGQVGVAGDGADAVDGGGGGVEGVESVLVDVDGGDEFEFVEVGGDGGEVGSGDDAAGADDGGADAGAGGVVSHVVRLLAGR